MPEKPIHKKILIDAPVSNVWRVFTDPAVTKLMGGSYVTDWKPGSSFGWRANSGQMYDNGKVLRVEKENLIEHTLVDRTNSTQLICTVQYRFVNKDGITELEATEIPATSWSDKQYEDASTGWDAALRQVKDIAESI